jgi:hypothetical protein
MERKLDPADEKRALAMGAKPATVAKWRKRGMPPAWRLKLIEDEQARHPAENAAPEPERLAG